MEKYMEWFKVSTELSQLKKKESAIRRDICSEMFNGSMGCEFSVKKVIDGFRITATQRINIGIDEAVFENIYPKLTIAEKSVIKFKPSIIKSIYEKLPVSLLHQSIIEKPAMPVLKMEKI